MGTLCSKIPYPLWELRIQKPSEPLQKIDSLAVVIKQPLPGRGGDFREALEPVMGTTLAGVHAAAPQDQPFCAEAGQLEGIMCLHTC